MFIQLRQPAGGLKGAARHGRRHIIFFFADGKSALVTQIKRQAYQRV